MVALESVSPAAGAPNVMVTTRRSAPATSFPAASEHATISNVHVDPAASAGAVFVSVNVPAPSSANIANPCASVAL